MSSSSGGFADRTFDPEFVSPVELRRQHVQVRSNALTHMMSVLEAGLRKEREREGSFYRFTVERLLDTDAHPRWALDAELPALQKLIETAGWRVEVLEIKNNCGAWLVADMSEPKPESPSSGGPYR